MLLSSASPFKIFEPMQDRATQNVPVLTPNEYGYGATHGCKSPPTRVHSLVVLREAQRNIVRVVVRGVEPAHKSAKS
jgi:hypothetical protein